MVNKKEKQMPRIGNLFDGKLSLQAFEELVADTFPGVSLIKRTIEEEGFEPGVTHGLHLYYAECGVKDKYGSDVQHLGTYRIEDSECWIFAHAFEHPGLAHLA
jgi:hypothetical protein